MIRLVLEVDVFDSIWNEKRGDATPRTAAAQGNEPELTNIQSTKCRRL